MPDDGIHNPACWRKPHAGRMFAVSVNSWRGPMDADMIENLCAFEDLEGAFAAAQVAVFFNEVGEPYLEDSP